MDCLCGLPAHFFVSRDGKPGYNCSRGRCRFYGLAPIQCEGYARVMPNVATPADAIILRCEATLHPDKVYTGTIADCYFLVKYYGNLTDHPEVVAALESDQLQPHWHVAAEAYFYPMGSYFTLVQLIRNIKSKSVLLQEIPQFFFRCCESLRLVEEQHRYLLDDANERRVLQQDPVYEQLKPFQQRGVEFIVRHGGRGMLADSMGLGKTVQAIAAAHYYRQEWPVLIVCPMSLTENWAKEFNRFCGTPFSRMTILQGAKARASSLHEVVIVSYSSLKCVENAQFNVVILDESHFIKAGDTKRSQGALRLCRQAKRVLLLSGTPAMSRPVELYSQLQAIHPSLVPSKNQYTARYCNAFISRFGVDNTGHSNANELHLFLQNFLIRRTKTELSNELPSKSRQLLYICITDRERKAMEKQVAALSRSMTANSSINGGANSGDLALQSRNVNAFDLKIAAARAKIPAVQDYVSSLAEQLLESHEKVIFFAHHQCMMEAIKEAVEAVRPKQPIDYIYIAGETPAAQREVLADHFRNEPTCSVAILSMQSSGTGHNFTCASTVVFAELDWNPSTHLQCEDRVHRIGQSSPCTIKYLLAEGTADTVIWPLLQTKLTVTTAMLENNEAAAHYHLEKDSEKHKVSRRDVSPVSVATQSTLDGFMKPSQPSGKGTPPLDVRAGVVSPKKDHNHHHNSSNNNSIDKKDLKESSLPSSPATTKMDGTKSTLIITLEEMERQNLRPKGPRNSAGHKKMPLPPGTPTATAGATAAPLQGNARLKTVATSVLQMLKQGSDDPLAPSLVNPVPAAPAPAPPPAPSASLSAPVPATPSPKPLISISAALDSASTTPSGAPRRTTFTFGSTASPAQTAVPAREPPVAAAAASPLPVQPAPTDAPPAPAPVPVPVAASPPASALWSSQTVVRVSLESLKRRRDGAGATSPFAITVAPPRAEVAPTPPPPPPLQPLPPSEPPVAERPVVSHHRTTFRVTAPTPVEVAAPHAHKEGGNSAPPLFSPELTAASASATSKRTRFVFRSA